MGERQLARRREQLARRRRRRIRTGVQGLALTVAAAFALNGAAAQAQVVTGALVISPGASKVVDSGLTLGSGQTSATFSFPGSSTGASVYFGLQTRATSTGAFLAKTRVQADGTVTVGLSRVAPGTETNLRTVAVPGLSVTSPTQLNVALAISGESPVKLAAKVWKAGTTTPGWQVSASDASGAVAGTGAVKPWAYLSGAARTGTVVLFAGLDADSSSAAAPVPAPSATATATATPKPTATATPAPTATPRPTATATATSTPKPTTSTTQPASGTSGSGSGTTTATGYGVPSGQALKTYSGNLVITQDGATYDGLDIKGFVDVKAADVKITNSVIRGGVATRNRGILNATDTAATNLLVENTTIKPANPSVLLDGLIGKEFTLRNVEIDGGVDAIKVLGDDVTIDHSWLHGSQAFANDLNQGGGKTHNDGVQVQGGTNVSIVNSKIEGAGNAAIMVTQDYKLTKGLKIQGNLLSGGACTVNISPSGKGSVGPINLIGNRFAKNSTVQDCAVARTASTQMTASGNVYTDNTPATINVWN